MIETGIIGTARKDHISAFEKHEGFRLAGYTEEQNWERPSKGVNHFSSQRELLDYCECLVFTGKNGYEGEILYNAVKKSKDIFICDIGGFTEQEIKNLIKLKDEAKVNIQFSRLDSLTPAVITAREIIKDPVFIELTNTLPLTGNQNFSHLLEDELTRMLNVLLLLVSSNHHRVTVRSAMSMSGQPRLINIRIDFDNNCAASLLMSPLTEKSRFSAKIHSTDHCCTLELAKPYLRVEKLMFKESGEAFKKVITPVLESSSQIIAREVDFFYSSISGKTVKNGNIEDICKIFSLKSEIMKKAGISPRLS